MMLHELNERLNNVKVTDEGLKYITNLYYILDLSKDDFAKIVDAVGIGKLAERSDRWETFMTAFDMLEAKTKYEAAKKRKEEIELELKSLNEEIQLYENKADRF